jgi:hypothetical protein
MSEQLGGWEVETFVEDATAIALAIDGTRAVENGLSGHDLREAVRKTARRMSRRRTFWETYDWELTTKALAEAIVEKEEPWKDITPYLVKR